jgi:hypothetical protein
MSDVNQLEQQLKQAKLLVERRVKALRLAENRDFRELVLEGFCRDDAARFAQQIGDPALDKKQQEDAASMAAASGHFLRYMRVITQQGDVAEREVLEVEEMLEEARAEGEIEDHAEGEEGPEA